MNYLAHILLSGDNPDCQVGGLLGDFVKGPLRGELPAPIEAGIKLHRAIDTHTSHLPAIRRLYPLFEAPWRRYAGIIIDIAFDHFLAKDWQHYHPRPLESFCTEFYRYLACQQALLPPDALHFSQRAPKTGWLESYADAEVMATVLQRVGSRLSRPVELGHSWHYVERHQACFERAFVETMAELESFAARFLIQQNMPLSSTQSRLIEAQIRGKTASICHNPEP